MLRRRLGHTFGLLFVLPCIAAYPLSWGRNPGVVLTGSPGYVSIGVAFGRLEVATLRTGRSEPVSIVADVRKERFSADRLWRVKFGRTSHGTSVSEVACFPLWIPALASCLFMAWRWQRRRKVRGAVGFPVDRA